MKADTTTECCYWPNQNVIRKMECSCSHKGMTVDTTECRCWQDEDVLKTRECCCEPIKMNIAARLISTIFIGLKQRPLTDLQTLLVHGKKIEFYLLQNFELLLQYIQKREIFLGVQEFGNFEVINTGCFLERNLVINLDYSFKIETNTVKPTVNQTFPKGPACSRVCS